MKKFKRILILPILLFTLFTFVGCDFVDDFKILNGVNNNELIVPTEIKVISVMNQDSVVVGETLSLYHRVIPSNASDKVVWSSNDETIAKVDNEGTVTGVRNGSTSIICKSFHDSSIYSAFNVNVYDTNIEATAIEIEALEHYYAGDKYTFKVTTTPNNARYSVLFESLNNVIAEFKGTTCYFKQPGNVTIKAYYLNSDGTKSGIETSIDITIEQKNLTPQKITLKGYNTLYVGDSHTLDCVVLPSNANNSVTFTSSDINICSVNALGQVKALNVGTCTITATSQANPQIASTFEIEVKPCVDIENIEDLSLQEQIKAVYNYNNRSVFGVVNYQYSSTTSQDEKNSLGTGFIYKAIGYLNDGSIASDINDENISYYGYYLITNRHVVKGSNSLRVYFAEYDKYIDCKLCGYDDKVDVSVCYFEYVDYIRPLKLDLTDSLETGDFVLAMGNPYSLSFYDSITLGIVANNKRYYSVDTDGDDVNDWDQLYIQHDAAINPGNSGGPLFNLKGEVVGINTMKLSAVDIDTMGFSIPVASFEPLIEKLEKSEKIVRPLLGVTVIECKNANNGRLQITETEHIMLPQGLTYGIYVNSVTPGSTADNAGVLSGDIILSIDGLDLIDSYTIRITLGKFIVGSGESTTIEVYRNNEVLKLTVVF